MRERLCMDASYTKVETYELGANSISIPHHRPVAYTHISGREVNSNLSTSKGSDSAEIV